MLGYGKGDIVRYFLEPLGGRMASAEEIIANLDLPMAVAGITKRIVPDQAAKKGLDWWYIDTGYFGNRASHKTWFRITRNATQNTGPILPRSDARLRRMKIDRTQYRRGSRVIVVPPDAKVCQFFQLPPPDQWIQTACQMISANTDRDVVIRQRPASRHTRSTTDRFQDFIRQDTWAVVTYTSNCAVESLLHGIPVVCLGPSAAQPLSGDITDIDRLPNLHTEQVDAWLRHLSYCQFTLQEMRSGTAWRLLNG